MLEILGPWGRKHLPKTKSFFGAMKPTSEASTKEVVSYHGQSHWPITSLGMGLQKQPQSVQEVLVHCWVFHAIPHQPFLSVTTDELHEAQPKPSLKLIHQLCSLFKSFTKHCDLPEELRRWHQDGTVPNSFDCHHGLVASWSLGPPSTGWVHWSIDHCHDQFHWSIPLINHDHHIIIMINANHNRLMVKDFGLTWNHDDQPTFHWWLASSASSSRSSRRDHWHWPPGNSHAKGRIT